MKKIFQKRRLGGGESRSDSLFNVASSIISKKMTNLIEGSKLSPRDRILLNRGSSKGLKREHTSRDTKPPIGGAK